MIAHTDPVVLPWLLGIVHHQPYKPGDFLISLADAALRADHENYPILRPALVHLKEKYPQYSLRSE